MPKRVKPILAGAVLALAAVFFIVSLVGQPRTVGASFSAREVGTASESQRRVLADGSVTLTEMNAAWESVRGCLQDSGYSPGPIGAGGPGTGFTIEVDYTDEADPGAADQAFLRTHAACEDECVALVGPTTPQNTDHRAGVRALCSHVGAGKARTSCPTLVDTY